MPFRLVLRDAHQLFQRLESQAQEYVLDVRVRLLKQMSTGLKTPQQACQFVSMLLDEYVCLCAAAKKQASHLTELVSTRSRPIVERYVSTSLVFFSLINSLISCFKMY